MKYPRTAESLPGYSDRRRARKQFLQGGPPCVEMFKEINAYRHAPLATQSLDNKCHEIGAKNDACKLRELTNVIQQEFEKAE